MGRHDMGDGRRWVALAALLVFTVGCQPPPEVPQSLEAVEVSHSPAPTRSPTPAPLDPYVEAASEVLPHLDPEQLQTMATETCDQLQGDWTVENVAAALLNSGADEATTLDYLDVLTTHACPDKRGSYDAFLSELMALPLPATPSPTPEMDVTPERVYVAIDPATVRGFLRQLWESYLGRAPKTDELDRWTTYYLDVDRDAFAAEDRGELWDVQARVTEAFYEAYGPERRMIEDRAEAAEQRELMRDVLDSVNCYATGRSDCDG